MQPSGLPMNDAQLKELQQLQRLQQEMQARMRQRQSQGGGNSIMLQPAAINSQQQQQRWMQQQQQQRSGSFTGGMNNNGAAMFLLQQQQQRRGSSTGSLPIPPTATTATNPTNARATLYLNAMQANNTTGSGNIVMGTAQAPSMNGMGASVDQQRRGSLNTMEALLLQQQQRRGSSSSVGGATNVNPAQRRGSDSSMNSMQALLLQQQQSLGGSQQSLGGSSASLLGALSNSQPQMAAASTSDQLLMQQQRIMADLKRKIQNQQQQEMAAIAAAGRRPSQQQRQAMFQMQQQQRQNSLSSSSNSLGGGMLGHVRSLSQASYASGAAAMMPPQQAQLQQQGPSINVEPISLASLMGGQPQSPPQQVRRGSNASVASLGNSGAGAASMLGAANMLTQQQEEQLQQQRQQQQEKLQQDLLSGMLQEPLQDSPQSQRPVSESASRPTIPAAPPLGVELQKREISIDSNATTKHSNQSDKTEVAPREQSFMDGTFEGGWQSNVDIPQRRQVIYDIVKLIEQMRPENDKASKKLPQMAKRLEEHLYRAARTKEEYLDGRTLKKRLQNVAHSLDTNRPVPGGSQATNDANQSQSQSDPRRNEVEQRTKSLQQQLQQMHRLRNLQEGMVDDYLNQQANLLQMQQAGLSSASLMTAGQNGEEASAIQSAAAGFTPESTRTTTSASSQQGILKRTSKYQDPESSRKQKVIKQQQQRLLLLRHASKCKAGGSCKTKHCAQMVKLWKHMKKCRDKNCKTPHCLSSRCVLNHYRMCKSANTTSTCEVCAPVMQLVKVEKISEEAGDESLTDRGGPAAKMPSSSVVAAEGSCSTSSSREAKQEIEAKQQKLQQQQTLLNQLKEQQAQVLEQKANLREQLRHVQPQTQQAAQLQQQQGLLDQLQNLFQQQQVLLQQEVTEAVEYLQRANETARKLSSSTDGRRQSSPDGRGVGKGKRLLDPTEYDGVDAPAGGMDSSPASRKRPLDRIGMENGAESSRTTKQAKLDDRDSHQKAVEQGDPDHSTSLIQSMPVAAVEGHLASLNDRLHVTPQTISQRCLPVVRKLIDDKFGWVFRDPVDPVALSLPDYYDIVKSPMHLSLVDERLRRAEYSDIESFANDTRLVFNNAILYNGDDSEVGEMATIMLRHFEKDMKAVRKGIERDQRSLHRDDACILCGVQRRLFEPVTLYCNGACGMQRIRRNAIYYTDHTKMNHWCTSCYSKLDDNELILLEDGSEVRKSALQKFKNDGLPEEAWVQCDDCKGWVHQICALFNGRRNKNAASYQCPKCHIERSRQGLLIEPERRVKVARDLPHSKMSEAIETGLHKTLEAAYEKKAADLGVDGSEVERADGLFVRVVSNMEKKHVVRDKMYRRYAEDGAASEFPVRSKCIALFQTIDGVDVILFAMYVYEYDDKCPAPNRRRVYVSYLDSVYYFQPKYYRTTAYHALIVEYLRYVKERGFHTAHIWSCPPSDGDDYVFYSHPKEQLVPREDMLLQWYHRMLQTAKDAGIVLETRTLYDEYFAASDDGSPPSGSVAKPTCLPYFEGDYIPGEIENIIKQIEEESSSQGDSAGLQDEVMKRLGQAMYNMKQNFMVVRMRSKDFVAAVDKGEDVTGWVDADSESEESSSKRIKIGSKDSDCLSQLPAHQQKVLGDLARRSGALVEEKAEICRVDGTPTVGSNEAERPMDDVQMDRSREAGGSSLNEEVAERLKKVEVTAQSSSVPEQTKEKSDESPDDPPRPMEPFDARPSGDKANDLPVEQTTVSAVSEGQVETMESGEKIPEKDQTRSQSEQSSGSSRPAESANGDLSANDKRDEDNTQNGVKVEEQTHHGQSDAVGETEATNPTGADLPADAAPLPNESDDTTVFDSAKVEPKSADLIGPVDSESSTPAPEAVQADSATETAEDDSASGVMAKSDPTEAEVEPSSSVRTEIHEMPNDESVKQESKEDPLENSQTTTEGDATNGNSIEQQSKEEPPENVEPIPLVSAEKKEVTETAESTTNESTSEEPAKPLKRGIDEVGPALSRHFASARNNAKPVGTTEDEDEPQETEMFESRQQFLNYCQANHFQFDELRRAKHSSMMILFQLHNPSAPMFLQQCGACYRDITHGTRYHCKDCSNFDLCQDCYEPVTTGLWAKRDSRFTHNKRHTFVAIDMEAPATASRDERTQAIKMHLELLSHAATCNGPPECSLNNCARMKKLFEHINSCEVTHRKGCKVCSRLLSLLTMHARMCTVRGSCPLPFCDRIRERNKRRKQQQQLMDDRRRQAQNALYRQHGPV